MTAHAGRSVVFTWNSAAVLGVREKGLELNGEAINITSDEDAGKRKLLDLSAEDTVDISLSGVSKDNVLKADWFGGTRTRAATLTYPDNSTISGNFFLASFSETGPYNDATTFEASLQSSGVVTYTP